jgi:hypothetical protein
LKIKKKKKLNLKKTRMKLIHTQNPPGKSYGLYSSSRFDIVL